MTIGRAARAAVLAALVVLTGVGHAQQPATAPPPSTGAAQDGFVPIDQLTPKEEMPAAPLVMAAYAVAWLVIFGYVWSLWRRIHKVEVEIADVSRRLSSGARR